MNPNLKLSGLTHSLLQNPSPPGLRVSIYIYPEVGLLQTDFLTFKSASRTPRFLHRNQVLNLRYFVVGSGPSLNFTALTLLRIPHKHFQVKNILVELFPLTKSHPKRSIYIMAINHLNTIAQYHTNYMFKVVLSRELIQE